MARICVVCKFKTESNNHVIFLLQVSVYGTAPLVHAALARLLAYEATIIATQSPTNPITQIQIATDFQYPPSMANSRSSFNNPNDHRWDHMLHQARLI